MLAFLGQKRPNHTNPETVLKQGTGNQEITVVNSIFITEVSGASATFSIFVTRIDSPAYNKDTAIIYQSALSPNDVVNISGEKLIVMDSTKMRLAVQVGNASAVNFTFFGERI